MEEFFQQVCAFFPSAVVILERQDSKLQQEGTLLCLFDVLLLFALVSRISGKVHSLVLFMALRLIENLTGIENVLTLVSISKTIDRKCQKINLDSVSLLGVLLSHPLHNHFLSIVSLLVSPLLSTSYASLFWARCLARVSLAGIYAHPQVVPVVLAVL